MKTLWALGIIAGIFVGLLLLFFLACLLVAWCQKNVEGWDHDE